MVKVQIELKLEWVGRLARYLPGRHPPRPLIKDHGLFLIKAIA